MTQEVEMKLGTSHEYTKEELVEKIRQLVRLRGFVSIEQIITVFSVRLEKIEVPTHDFLKQEIPTDEITSHEYMIEHKSLSTRKNLFIFNSVVI